MTLRIGVMIAAALLVLGYLWWRGRRRVDRPGRGLLDEAATAYEDVAEEIIDTGDPAAAPRPARPRVHKRDGRDT